MRATRDISADVEHSQRRERRRDIDSMSPDRVAMRLRRERGGETAELLPQDGDGSKAKLSDKEAGVGGPRGTRDP